MTILGRERDGGRPGSTPGAVATTAPLASGVVTALGLMSGTSLDGVDAAIVSTDGERIERVGPALTEPYPEAFRARLRAIVGRRPEESDAEVIAELTERHADAARRLLAEAALVPGDLDVVGFHGQTVLHAPERRETIQVGSGEALARALGVPVVCDFRSADVAAGGQGAPLVPAYHRALAAALDKPTAILNIGGVANVTFVGDGELLAFDTGPGGALIDDWMRARAGRSFDDGGAAAATGRVEEALVARWLADAYFRAPPPKSLDRDRFRRALDDLAGVSVEDGAATLAAFTAGAVAAAAATLPVRPKRWLVCGGGRRNRALMARIAAALGGAVVEPVEAAGWRGDWLEAEAFAFLAARSLRGLPISWPGTTGAPRPLPGGRLIRP